MNIINKYKANRQSWYSSNAKNGKDKAFGVKLRNALA